MLPRLSLLLNSLKLKAAQRVPKQLQYTVAECYETSDQRCLSVLGCWHQLGLLFCHVLFKLSQALVLEPTTAYSCSTIEQKVSHCLLVLSVESHSSTPEVPAVPN